MGGSLNEGDIAVVVRNGHSRETEIHHGYLKGDLVTVNILPGKTDKGYDRVGCTPYKVKGGSAYQVLSSKDLEKVEDMATSTKTKNPKNFRNGDVIKITPRGGHPDAAVVFVKFGENYYNLSEGGQMKAHKYLPHGNREVIATLSGMGRFFLMSEDELETQVSPEKAEIPWNAVEDKCGNDPSEELKRVLREWEEKSGKSCELGEIIWYGEDDDRKTILR